VTASVAARVGRGMALLDERVPGWVDRIDVDRLDVSHPGDCPLGQLFGSYERAWRVLFPEEQVIDGVMEMPDDFPADAGFDAYAGPQEWQDVLELNDEWAARIIARRALDVAKVVATVSRGSGAAGATLGAACARASAGLTAAGRSTLCAHADQNGDWMHWLNPGERCPLVGAPA